MKTNNLSALKRIVVGVQFLFVAFGATVLVPLLIDIDPSIALFTAGAGTLIFHAITKGKVPVFLGSSFVFIAPIVAATKEFGYPGALGGLIAVGALYALISGVVKMWGLKFIEKLFPPVVVGPIIMVIGLSLSSIGVNMAQTDWPLALLVLTTAIASVVWGKGLFKLIPIFLAIIVGYVFSAVNGNIDFTAVSSAAWFALPEFITPTFKLEAILYMLPVAIAPIIEHLGDMYVIGNVAQKDFVKDPGLHRTILGDGIATMFAGFLGGPPNTTYSEVTGAIALTKITNPQILQISAVTAIVFSLIEKVSAFLKTIPEAVLGGVMLLLFGMIASVGVKTVVDSKIDFTNTRNQVIVAVIFTLGIGGAKFDFSGVSLEGIGLASLIGVFLHLILPKKQS